MYSTGMKKVSERSTKKELLDAVGSLEAELAGKGQMTLQPESTPKSDKKQVLGASQPQTVGLPAPLREMLEKASAVGDAVQGSVKTLSGLAEQFAKELVQSQEEYERERQTRSLLRMREAEEYEYATRKERREQKDAFERELSAKKIAFEENALKRAVELDSREKVLREAEQECAQMRKQIENYPKEMEKAIAAAEERSAQRAREEAKIHAEMSRKDHEREREVSALRISNLESQLKRSDAAILALEKQLAAASQKAQELATTVIESTKQPAHSPSAQL